MSYLLLFLFLNLHAPQAAQENLNPLKSIPTIANFMTTDHFGNVYLANENVLWKLDKNGNLLSSYNTRQYGNITFVDATDPYKILVFHRDYGILQFLDNFMSQNASPIELQELNFDQAQLACNSSENGFWIYDPTKQKIERIDRNFQTTHQTVNLRQWFGNNFRPNYMLEYNQRLYVNDPLIGILVFDQFATYVKTIPLLGLDSPQILEDAILFNQSGKYCSYGLETLEQNCKLLSTKTPIDVRISKDRLYVLEQGLLSIFKYE